MYSDVPILPTTGERSPIAESTEKSCFSQKLLTGDLSTAHRYPCASPTKRDNTPFKKTVRSGAAVAEVPAGRSGRLLSSPQCISCSQFDVKMFLSLLNTNKQNFKAKQRCRDGVINGLCLGVGIFLFPFFFMP